MKSTRTRARSRHARLLASAATATVVGLCVAPPEADAGNAPDPARASEALPSCDGPVRQACRNSLGMPFVPVPHQRALFSAYLTRVQDFQQFVDANPRPWPKPGFDQGPTHPAVNVSWFDARDFCHWLNDREKRGASSGGVAYRLPTDAEWSAGAGLADERAGTPAEKSDVTRGVYVWGEKWPPPTGVANLRDAAFVHKYAEKLALKPDEALVGYDDGFPDTSPVGQFPANRFGLYDMDGNVTQWVADWVDAKGERRVVRGNSFNRFEPDYLQSARRGSSLPGNRDEPRGFRCVLGTAAP